MLSQNNHGLNERRTTISATSNLIKLAEYKQKLKFLVHRYIVKQRWRIPISNGLQKFEYSQLIILQLLLTYL